MIRKYNLSSKYNIIITQNDFFVIVHIIIHAILLKFVQIFYSIFLHSFDFYITVSFIIKPLMFKFETITFNLN